MPMGQWPAQAPTVFWQIFGKFRSFSAVAAPIFARKYAFCSIFQDPKTPDFLAEFFLILQTSPKRRLLASLRGAAAGGLEEFAVRR